MGSDDRSRLMQVQLRFFLRYLFESLPALPVAITDMRWWRWTLLEEGTLLFQLQCVHVTVCCRLGHVDV